jgi:hypothetical protein
MGKDFFVVRRQPGAVVLAPSEKPLNGPAVTKKFDVIPVKSQKSLVGTAPFQSIVISLR